MEFFILDYLFPQINRGVIHSLLLRSNIYKGRNSITHLNRFRAFSL
jgi:hypothetical protein